MNKKGFTIAETVISITVIIAISFIAISTVLTNQKISRRSHDTFCAVSLCSNLTELFKYAVDNSPTTSLEDVKNTFSNYLPTTLPNATLDNNIIRLNNNWAAESDLTNDIAYILNLSISSESDGLFLFSASITDKNSVLVYETSFSMAGGGL